MLGIFSFLKSGVQTPLEPKARKAFLLGATLLLAFVYTGFALRQYLAAHYFERPGLDTLQLALRLDPGNAEYSYRLGRYYSLVQQDPVAAVKAYKTAVQLNPHPARYWLDLAAAFQVLGSQEEQKNALEHAIQVDPRTPDVAWQAANLYLVRGETQEALREFRIVLQNDPSLSPSALQLCWRAKPDVDALLQEVLPPSPQVFFAFLDVLISKKETAGTAKVWEQLVHLRQPLETRRVFDYIRYLIAQREVEQARLVWQQGAGLCGLSAYLASADNLVVNGDFSLEVLNGGFDWLYHKQPAVSLALDPSDFHSGHRSLSIVFEGQGVNDAGIRQLIPVQPSTSYDFSAYFKARNIEGAGGPRFALQDLYDETTYFASDELRDADFWKQVSGSFTTGPATKLLMLRVQRVPAYSPIRGQLWIDDIRLARKQP